MCGRRLIIGICTWLRFDHPPHRQVSEYFGDPIYFQPARLSARVANFNALTACSVEGPPELLQALGVEKHQIVLKISPFSKLSVRDSDKPNAIACAFSFPWHEQLEENAGVSATRLLLALGGYVYVDDDGDVCAVDAINLDGKHKLRMNGPHVLSPWSQLKLAQAGRFAPVTVQAIRDMGAQSFAWVPPNEMRIAISHGKHNYKGCEEGAFIYCTGPDGTGNGAFMRLVSSGLPGTDVRVRVSIKTLSSQTHGDFVGTVHWSMRMFEIKDDIARHMGNDTRAYDLSLSFDGKALSETDTLEMCKTGAGQAEVCLEAICTKGAGPFTILASWRPKCMRRLKPSKSRNAPGVGVLKQIEEVGAGAVETVGAVISSTVEDIQQAGEAAVEALGDGLEDLVEADRLESTDGKDSKALFYELLFYQADGGGIDFISFEDARQLLAFLQPTMRKEAREKLLLHCESGGTRDGRLDREEFIEMCLEAFADISMETLNNGLKDHSTSLQVLAERQRVKVSSMPCVCVTHAGAYAAFGHECRNPPTTVFSTPCRRAASATISTASPPLSSRSFTVSH